MSKKVSTSSRISMGGAVRLMRKNSGSLSISDRSFDEEDDEEDDSICSSKSPEPKRRKSTLWESSPKRNVLKKKISLISETAMIAVDPTDTNDGPSKTRSVISSKRSSSCSIKSTDSTEYTRCDSALSLSSSDARLSSSKLWSLEEFTLGKALGKGRFGNVYLAKQKRTNFQLAFKVLFKAPMQAAQCVNALRREVEIQSRINHPNVVNMYGYFHDTKNVYLLLEYLSGGELYKHMSKSDGHLDESTCHTYMRDIASGLSYLHARGVMHRDIKPENILIGEDGVLRLTDLGWAAHSPLQGQSCSTGTGTGNGSIRYTMCGTPEYLAPEMILGMGHNLSVDLWALGILLYEMLYGRTPFFERQRRSSGEDADSAATAELEARQKMFSRIQGYKDNLNFPPLPLSTSSSSSVGSRRSLSTSQMRACRASSSTSSTLSFNAQFVISSLLKRDPAIRMTAAEILQSDWMLA